ncbi:MAG: hypothetical protein U0835_02230 [Isosphaeraceae bacterium]
MVERKNPETSREPSAGDASPSDEPVTKRELLELMPQLLQGVLRAKGLSDETSGLVQLLAAKTNDSQSEVLRKALTLYGLAVDAIEKGNHVAILTPDDEILHEVVGFDPAEASPR